MTLTIIIKTLCAIPYIYRKLITFKTTFHII